jgi:phospholipid-binding lipoprotein MlaA
MKKLLSLVAMCCAMGMFTKISFAGEAQAESSIFNSEAPFLPSAQQDPLESINRPIFNFNQAMDTVLITPIAKIYNTLIPSPIRTGADNVFDNIAMLSSTANDLLQGEFKLALNDAWRFIINTTMGVGGIFDPATEFGLQEHFNDMGITFARWGYRNSSYIVLPILGPTTVRDGVAFAADYYLFSPYPYVHSMWLLKGIIAYRYLTIKAQLIDANNFMNEVALDPYTFERDAYYQYRNHKIATGSNADTSEYLYLEENEPQDEKPDELGAEAGDHSGAGAGYIRE